MQTENDLSPDAEFMRRTCGIFAYMLDSRISPYPCVCDEESKKGEEDSEYLQNQPDMDESITDFLVREVLKADNESRNEVVEKAVQDEETLVSELQEMDVQKIEIGERFSQHTSSGMSAESEARKKRAETTIKVQQHNERRRHNEILRHQKEKEKAVKELREESKRQKKYREDLNKKEREQKQVYGKYRAEELRRQKEENRKKREEEMKKEKEAKKMIEECQRKTEENKRKYKREEPEEQVEEKTLSYSERKNRMKEISKEIYDKNKTMSPRKSPRKDPKKLVY